MQSKPLKPKVVIGKNVPWGILNEIMLFIWSYAIYTSLQDFCFVFRLQRTKKEKSDASKLSVKKTESAKNENEESNLGIGIFSIV